MSRRSRIWLVVAVLFSVLNVAGAGWAAVHGELLHGFLHAVLTVLGAFAARRIVAPRAITY